MRKTLLAFGILIYVLISAIPAVYGESDSKRANDGFNDGSNAARTDTTFNPACDPLGLHTSDDQHTTIYCNAWAQGYTSTWDSIHGQFQGQDQRQGQQQKQSQSGTCIAVTCNQIQGSSQRQAQGNGQ